MDTNSFSQPSWNTPVRKNRLEKLVRIASGKKYIKLFLANCQGGYTKANTIYVGTQYIPNKIFPGISDDLWMLIVQRAIAMHELGHVLWSNWNESKKVYEELKNTHGLGVAHIYVEVRNCIEDARIDRGIAQEFPGAGFYIKKLRENDSKIVWEKIRKGSLKMEDPFSQYCVFLYDQLIYNSGVFEWLVRNDLLHPVTKKLVEQTSDLISRALKEPDPKQVTYIYREIALKIHEILTEEMGEELVTVQIMSPDFGCGHGLLMDEGVHSRRLRISGEVNLERKFNEIVNRVRQEKSSDNENVGGKDEEIESNDGSDGNEEPLTQEEWSREETDEETDNESNKLGSLEDEEDDVCSEDTMSEETEGEGEEEYENEEECGVEDKELESESDEESESYENEEEVDNAEEVGSLLDEVEECEEEETLPDSESGEICKEELQILKELARELAQEKRELRESAFEPVYKDIRTSYYHIPIEYGTPDYSAWRQFSEDRIKSVGNIVARNLLTVLRERVKSKYKSGFRSGRLHTKSLWKLQRNNYKIFKRKEREKELNYQCFILLDRSGSMAVGNRIRKAVYATLILTYALEKVGIQVEVLGFNDRRITVHKQLEEKFEIAKYKMADLSADGWTPTHIALNLVKQRIKNLARKNPFIIIVTDGAPDSVTKTIEEIKTSPYPVVGVTVENTKIDWEQIYHAEVKVESIDDLLPALTQLVRKLMF